MRMKQWRGGLVVIAILECRRLFGRATTGEEGANQGQLAPCPDSPNCVSSQAADEIDGFTLRYQVSERGRAQLLAVLDGMDRAEIVQADENYIHAQFVRRSSVSWTTWNSVRLAGLHFLQVRSAARDRLLRLRCESRAEWSAFASASPKAMEESQPGRGLNQRWDGRASGREVPGGNRRNEVRRGKTDADHPDKRL